VTPLRKICRTAQGGPLGVRLCRTTAQGYRIAAKAIFSIKHLPAGQTLKSTWAAIRAAAARA
jgi:hypothetical protein